ncbi:uncharacterized protein DUF3866 [Antricoccus suffuscus]|uniref:Uncharacterized protein DUF3866 n=1 Tax=Antricoccus suffuscus TaxID=1629062 RepID=A0A2T1A0L5_9ACTN|nr:DUF3866 family protein [Antricoccus suffuscus]PRZ42146.1 uncharacterized protein DUF3866 [Antricoccus suffuscus]
MPTDPQTPAEDSLIRWRRGVVVRERKRWRGAVELDVEIEGRVAGEPDRQDARAIAYPALVGTPRAGESVLLNTTALAIGLGTGGYAVVIANLDRLPDDREGLGHLVKARYTPLQATVLGVDEQDSPHHDTIAGATHIGLMPVVVADLHSALPAILAGIQATSAGLKVAYVWTDGGALPAWFSRTVADLGDRLAATITVGQAMGGDHEAVSIHSGLLAAKHVVGADIAIVAQGPGNLGTGTPWGFSGVAAGEAINAVNALGGLPIGALRISDADPRGRHVGVSHHSTTAFFKVGLGPVRIPLPDSLPDELARSVASDLADRPDRAVLERVDTSGLDEALRTSPVRLSTMGRTLDEDYAYFLTNAAAGRFAATALTTA